MIITAWNEAKDLVDWINNDFRVHPELTYDDVRKRLKRSGPLSIPEMALTTPVIKGAQKGDTKARIKDRRRKQRERYKNFALAKKVRERYSRGVDREDIKARFGIKENFLQKIISNLIYCNVHWLSLDGTTKVPDHFSEVRDEVDTLPTASDGLEIYDVGDTDD